MSDDFMSEENYIVFLSMLTKEELMEIILIERERTKAGSKLANEVYYSQISKVIERDLKTVVDDYYVKIENIRDQYPDRLNFISWSFEKL